MYLYGQAVKKDIFKAACWFANMNNLNSFDMRTEFFDLAEEYRTGDNVERDIDKAIDWYERIILCGAGDYIQKKSLLVLAEIYFKGDKVDNDVDKDLDYYERAANLVTE